MRQRTMIEVREDHTTAPRALLDTYERVRRTLDDALAELELPLDGDDNDSAPLVLV
jgi:hypothetical protein